MAVDAWKQIVELLTSDEAREAGRRITKTQIQNAFSELSDKQKEKLVELVGAFVGDAVAVLIPPKAEEKPGQSGTPQVLPK